MKNEKSVAAAFSLLFHLAIFVILAFCGLFAFLQQRETTPLEVSVYDEDTYQNQLSGSTGSVGSMMPRSETMEIAISGTSLPAISETYTQAVEQEREVKRIVAETGVDQSVAKKEVAEKFKTIGIGTKSGNTDNNGNSTGNGAGEGTVGNGTGVSGSTGEGSGSSHVRPAQRAVLVGQPDTASYYPADLRQKGITGNVSIQVTISSEGSVTNAYVTGSSGYGSMDTAAVQIAYLCQYRPAINENGEAVSSTRNVSIPFYIR